jgi:hypothetical protein
MLYAMHAEVVATSSPPRVDPNVLDAMALLAHEEGLVVHVVSPLAPGILERARAVAEQGGLNVTVDVRTHTSRVRFAPTQSSLSS